MQAWLIALGAGAMVGALAVWLVYRAGKRAARTEIASDSAAVKDDQLKAANEAPQTPRELADYLRKGGQF